MDRKAKIVWFCEKLGKEILCKKGNIINSDSVIIYPSCKQCKAKPCETNLFC